MEAKLRRREKARKKKDKKTLEKIWIFTEGDVTEPEYFEAWKAEFLNRKDYARLEIQKSNSESDPKSVYNKAETQLNASTNKDKKDHIFIVIDEDNRFDDPTKKQNLTAILEKCTTRPEFTKEKVNCIFSNRSFEFWGLLHFLEHPSNAPLTKTELKTELQTYLKSYSDSNKRFDFALMKDNIPRAKLHAQRIRAFHASCQDNEYTACSTTNVDELLDFLETHLDISSNET